MRASVAAGGGDDLVDVHTILAVFLASMNAFAHCWYVAAFAFADARLLAPPMSLSYE